MQKLDNIIWAWGCWVARNHGTSCHFTQAMNYGNASELNGNDKNGDPYHAHQCTATLTAINYDNNSLPTNGANVAYDLWYDNATDVNQSVTFAASSATTKTFTWSVTETLSIGIEFNQSAGVPGVASFGAKESVTLSFSSTQGNQTAVQQTWSVNDPVVIPAQTSVHCQMVISTQNYDINWIAPVVIKGRVAVWFNDWIDISGGNDVHHLWFVPIETVLADVNAHHLYDTTGYGVVDDGITATVKGNFSGSQGIRVDTKPIKTPLRGGNAPKVMVPTARPAEKTGKATA